MQKFTKSALFSAVGKYQHLTQFDLSTSTVILKHRETGYLSCLLISMQSYFTKPNAFWIFGISPESDFAYQRKKDRNIVIMKTKNKLKTAVIILAVLLLLSIIGLVLRILYLEYESPKQQTTVSPDNTIGESSSDSDTVIELNGDGSDANVKFRAENMLPGDTETKYFNIRIHHNSQVKLCFATEVTGQTKSLADKLRIKVTLDGGGKVICDSTFSAADGTEYSEIFLAAPDGQTDVSYRIEVSLGTDAGNEYQAAELTADFKWYISEEENTTEPPQENDGSGSASEPETNDGTDTVLKTIIIVSILLFVFLVILLLVLFLVFRRKKEV